MPDPPLSRLLPGNPENLLSREARQRIGRAFLEYDLIRKQALSAIEIRYRAEPCGLSFSEYLFKGQAGIDFAESRMKAARTVLRAEAEEYGNLGLPGREFREIIEGKIDEMVYSLEFSSLQRDALGTEFLWPAPPTTNETTSDEDVPEVVVPSRSIESIAGADRVEKYRTTVTGQSKGDFAATMGIDPKTLRSLLTTKKASPDTWLALANGMRMKLHELLGD